MSEKKPLPRGKFDAVVSGCMEVLARHGFVPQPLKTDSRFSDIFEDVCFGWFGDVSPKPRVPDLSKGKACTQRQMDQMTLECALVFTQHGVKSVSYNESLNSIRASIADVIEAMGYESTKALCYASYPGWGCYKLWEEVARQDGLGDEEIAETRKYFRENLKKYYETA